MKAGLKKRLKNRELTIGSWLQIPSTIVAEIMAKTGFDWLVIDLEHSAISIDQASLLIQTIDLAGCVPLVRLSVNDFTLIKRVMDCGAHGIIVPNVNSAQEAERAVQATRYPPQGNRGVGLYRAQGYGCDFEEYKNWQKNNCIVIVQIEHIDGVKNLEAILNTEGVDGFIIGPYDLSASLGIPGEFEHKTFKKALSDVHHVSEKIMALMGTHIVEPNVSKVKKKFAEGYRFIAFSIDTFLLVESCETNLSSIHGRIE